MKTNLWIFFLLPLLLISSYFFSADAQNWPEGHDVELSSSWPDGHDYEISTTWGYEHIERQTTWPANHTGETSATWPWEHSTQTSNIWGLNHYYLFSESWPESHYNNVSKTWPDTHRMGESQKWPGMHSRQASETWPAPHFEDRSEKWPKDHQWSPSLNWGEHSVQLSQSWPPGHTVAASNQPPSEDGEPKVTTQPDGTRIGEYPDGTIVTEYSNGYQIGIRLPGGHILALSSLGSDDPFTLPNGETNWEALYEFLRKLLQPEFSIPDTEEDYIMKVAHEQLLKVISGTVENYKAGTDVKIIIQKPDKTLEQRTIVATNDGYYQTDLEFSDDSQIGKYTIIALYNSKPIDVFGFSLVKELTIQWIKTYPDGTREGVFPDGTKITEYSTGERLTEYTNGIRVTEYPDGTIVGEYVDGTIVTEDPDGNKVTEFADGTIVGESPDGNKVTEFADGTIVGEYADGTKVTEFADGTKVTEYADGTKVTEYADGTKVTEYPDGRIITTGPAVEERIVPVWIKNNAKWWSSGQISDKDYANGLGNLIKAKVIIIEGITAESGVEISDDIQIPAWIKNNAKWWTEGSISEDDYLNGIKFMVETKIIDLNPQVSLVYPQHGSTIAGLQSILVKSLEDTTKIKLEISSDGVNWKELGDESNQFEKIHSPKLGDVWITEWDTIGLESGKYQLRTSAVLPSGKVLSTQLPLVISSQLQGASFFPFTGLYSKEGSCANPPEETDDGTTRPTEHILKRVFLDRTNDLTDCDEVEVTIYVKQPVPGKRELIDDNNDVGHTFIQIKCGDIVLTLGFYPKDGLGPSQIIGNFKTPGHIRDDTSHLDDYDVKKTWKIPVDQARKILDFINNWDTEYQLDGNNCTDFAAGAARAGGIEVPDGNKTPWPYIGGTSTNPADMGEDLMEDGGERCHDSH